MNRYSVMLESENGSSNNVCKTMGEVIDAVIDGLKYDGKMTIVKIPPELDGKPETVLAWTASTEPGSTLSEGVHKT